MTEEHFKFPLEIRLLSDKTETRTSGNKVTHPFCAKTPDALKRGENSQGDCFP